MKKELFIAILSWVMFILLCINIRWVNELFTITNEIAIFSNRNFDSTEAQKGILNHINIALCKEYPNRTISFVSQVPRFDYAVIFNCDKTFSDASWSHTDITIGYK